jgi:1-acyl-sn-glycerol-3-phosphate acyltransferase
MLRFLPAFLLGIINIVLHALTMLFWPWPVFTVALLRLIPIRPWQRCCNYFLHNILIYWAAWFRFIRRLTMRIEWDLRGVENLKPDDWYLLISNHQSWVDILVLSQVFNHRIPPVKFFMKKELLWTLPFAGLAAKLLDFPFMERHSKSALAKRPDLKGKDLLTTRKACEKFKYTPTTVLNFVEGTRFTPQKHAQQASPYQYLLRPKAGGTAFALGAMGEYFHKILNITVVYPNAQADAWHYFSGRIKKIVVHVEELLITPDLLGDYENNREFRVYFQQWLNDLWRRKDKLIEEILHNNHAK